MVHKVGFIARGSKKRQTSIGLPLSIVPLSSSTHTHGKLQFNATRLRGEVANCRTKPVFVVRTDDGVERGLHDAVEFLPVACVLEITHDVGIAIDVVRDK